KVQLVFEESQATTLFNEGEIVYCKYGDMEGKEAIFSLLAKQKGTFTYTKGLSVEEKKFPVLGGFMGLVMEGLRRIDEEQGDED
ncbi:MAG: DUF4388 domain-containing protein, partial [Candidatus Electrothrix sp. AUS1_2]|nr:DUF4388 domain-containing protein [Candidatus Electrothrix sp. AUS1_2]